MTLAGETTLIPEFHDCQRLIDNDHSFGPLVGIWVPNYLGKVEDLLPDVETAIPVAVIHAWDGPYPPLHIEQMWNCLYLMRDPANRGEFLAEIVKVEKESACAGSTRSASLRGHPLNVTRLQYEGLTLADYPSVGRWDRDRRQPKHFIGLQCGAAWCEISRGNHGSSRRYSLRSTEPSKKRRVFEVKGWYDEQYLAVKGAPGKLEPLPFLGTIVPDAGLNDRRAAEFEGEWIPAGVVSLEETSVTYQDKLGLFPGALPNGNSGSDLTHVSLCWEHGGKKCLFLPASKRPDCQWDPVNDKDRMWYSRSQQPGPITNYSYKCVDRHDHSGLGIEIPGTARWAWREDDETQWWRCDKGCCSVRP
ncbi:MAG: hypothetical protein OEV95_07375 [Gemmatimonadota bacterium]|nr:hypothetical protein [Gemmatimonadota bacterium]